VWGLEVHPTVFPLRGSRHVAAWLAGTAVAHVGLGVAELPVALVEPVIPAVATLRGQQL